MSYDFRERLEFSLGQQQASDLLTIQSMIPGCVSVEDSSPELNRRGVDYIARLRRGAEILIDAKTRSKGCSRHWNGCGPEFALETWSVRPGGKYRTHDNLKKIGWTLSESSSVDMILFKFDPADSTKVYLVGFQLLRIAFRRFFKEWYSKFKVDIQDSKTWESECVFVPSSVVYDSMSKVSVGILKANPNE